MVTRKGFMTLLALAALISLLPPIGAARAATVVDERFRDYYNQHQGMRVLGSPLTNLTEANGYPAQYFEKGRIEDHRSEITHPDWAFMYGLLTVELMDRDPNGSVNTMGITYAALKQAAAPQYRRRAPWSFGGGTMAVHDGIFVPVEPLLHPAPGHVVPLRFWNYINRRDLFPGGWLHDIGLPLTEAITVETYKNGELREISYQAFERTVLTYDPQNPLDWQVERGNIGTDALRTLGLAPAGTIELPAPDAPVTLPLHILARVGQPGDQLVARLRWLDGTTLSNTFKVLRGENGRGLLIGNLDWINMLQPPEPATQQAMLEIRTSGGVVLAQRRVTVLSSSDSNTQAIQVYWTISGTDHLGAQTRQIVKTPRIGTAALEELLWGPPPISQIGYGTAIPTPEQVLSYPGREPGWGLRVTLRGLTIENGVATADFSKELRAYGGGSVRVQAIRAQITRTLMQFPSVQEVRIAIEGQTEGVLEP